MPPQVPQHSASRIWPLLVGFFVLFAGVMAALLVVTTPVQKRLDLGNENGPAATFVAQGCEVSAHLINACRPWLGVTYPKAADWQTQLPSFENHIGHKAEVVQTYHAPTQTALTMAEKRLLDRGSYLSIDWRPDVFWSKATGNDQVVNGRIDALAATLRGLGSKKVFLSLYSRPESGVSGGAQCHGYTGDKGTASEYRQMWRNVHDRFAERGVRNVVWVMGYSGDGSSDCAVKALWPGNELVDWVAWRSITNNASNFAKDASRFQTFLTENTDTKHAFTTKPWALSEVSFVGSPDEARRFYDAMKQVIVAHTFSHVKMYLVPGMSQARQPTLADVFKAATAIKKPMEATDGQVPSLAITNAPQQGADVTGNVQIAATVGDNHQVRALTLRVDGKWVATDDAAPYNFVLNTRQWQNGRHSYMIRAWDMSGNRTDSALRTIVIDN